MGNLSGATEFNVQRPTLVILQVLLRLWNTGMGKERIFPLTKSYLVSLRRYFAYSLARLANDFNCQSAGAFVR
jgi:hypothetical protein